MPKFLELFAGIGLVRKGLELASSDWICVGANDIDLGKSEIYNKNFGYRNFIRDDISNIKSYHFPNPDVITASFPCQDVSLAGNRLGLGGERSGLFFDFLRIVDEYIHNEHRPNFLVIENVMGLVSSNNGNDLKTVVKMLNFLGYCVDLLVLDAANFLPQSRVRIFIIGVNKNIDIKEVREKTAFTHKARKNKALFDFYQKNKELDWVFLDLEDLTVNRTGLSVIIDTEDKNWFKDNVRLKEIEYITNSTNGQKKIEKAILKATLLNKSQYLTGYRRMREHVVCLELRDDDVAGCLRTPTGGSSKQLLIEVTSDSEIKIRYMNPREYARLQGVNDDFWISDNIRQSLYGFGDAVAVPVITWIGKQIERVCYDDSKCTLQNSTNISII